MKTIKFGILFLIASIVCNPISAFDNEHEQIENSSNSFDSFFDIIMPYYKEVMRNHFDEIEWARQNYILERVKSNEIIDMVVNEMVARMQEDSDKIVDTMMERMLAPGLPQAVVEAARLNMKMALIGKLPEMFFYSFRRDAQMYSEIYQEKLKERKER